MHFRKALNSDHLAADDFVDAKTMEPVVRTLTIAGARMQKPPAGGKEKLCIAFKETEKTAFFAASQIKLIAHSLRRGDTDDWVGARLSITSRETTMKGQKTTGMQVVKAAFEKAPQKEGADVQPQG